MKILDTSNNHNRAFTKLIVLLITCFFASWSSADDNQLAFPGAEGFGRYAKGGRGGIVCEVTNIHDYESGTTRIIGSLRECLEDTSGPRTIVFRVSGTIDMKSHTMRITDGYVTVAGQTAPGDGILLKGGYFLVQSSDVIIRHIRVRPGGLPNITTDSMRITDPGTPISDIIIDHSSFSWATDEVTSIWGDVTNVTFQWNIIAEGLDLPDDPASRHPEGRHSKGHLSGGGATSTTLHHNLFAHNDNRNPAYKGGEHDFVNNVIYNMGAVGSVMRPFDAPLLVNFVGNYYKHRPSGYNSAQAIRIFGGEGYGETIEAYAAASSISAHNNIDTINRPDYSYPETDAIRSDDGGWSPNYFSLNRFNYPPVITTDAFQAYEDVLQGAGATIPRRDAIDNRIVNEVKTGTGRIVDDISDTPGYPNFTSVARPSSYDTDHDGMPNDWETQYSFDTSNPNDGALDADGDGYTNLEEFLNGTAPRDETKRPSPPTNLRIISS